MCLNLLLYLLYIILLIILFLNAKIVLSAQNEDKLYEKIDLFSEVLEKIEKEYVEEIDQSEAMDSAINGVLQSLDPYSSYMSPEIFEESNTIVECWSKYYRNTSSLNNKDTFIKWFMIYP